MALFFSGWAHPLVGPHTPLASEQLLNACSSLGLPSKPKPVCPTTFFKHRLDVLTKIHTGQVHTDPQISPQAPSTDLQILAPPCLLSLPPFRPCCIPCISMLQPNPSAPLHTDHQSAPPLAWTPARTGFFPPFTPLHPPLHKQVHVGRHKADYIPPLRTLMAFCPS